MNTRHLLASLATVAAAAMLTACTHNDITPLPATGKQVTLTATTTGTTATRLTHADATPGEQGQPITVTWKAADEFKLYGTAATGQTFTLSEGAGTRSGSFTGTLPANTGTTYSAFYPAAKALQADGTTPATTYAACVLNMNNQEQKGNNNLDHLAAYHYLTASGASITPLELTHRVAFLKFIVTLPAGEKPTSLTLSCPATGTPDNAIMLTQQADGTGTPTYGPQELKLSPSAGDAPTAMPSTFTAYMAVLPTTLTGSYTVTVNIDPDSSTDGVIIRTFETPCTNFAIAAGKVYDMVLDQTTLPITVAKYIWNKNTQATPGGLTTAVAENPGTEGNPYLIHTAADLKCFFTDDSYCTATNNNYYKLTHNIEINLDTWTPKDFKGKCFDGGNCTITGQLITTGAEFAGFFGAVSNSSTIQWLNINCTVKATHTATLYVGGICGQNEGIISYCNNKGSINAISDSGNTNAGGICGQNYVTISHCNNEGSIKCEGTAEHRLGGICGINDYEKISYCRNEGNKTIEGITTKEMVYAGGICGYSRNGAGTISYCNNTSTGSIIAQGIKENNGYQTSAGGICGLNEANSKIYTSHYTGNATITATHQGNPSYAGLLVGSNLNAGKVYTCCTPNTDESKSIGNGAFTTCATPESDTHE